MIRVARRVAADCGLRELGQANRQVDVRSRVIDAPVGSVAPRIARERDPAEVETAVEVFRPGLLCVEKAAESALTELRFDLGGERHRQYRGEGESDGALGRD